MIRSLDDFEHIFFIGIAGTGMSAIAQYLVHAGKKVRGSDRYFKLGEYNETKQKLEAEGIECFLQNGEGINEKIELVVVSAAIEDTVSDVQKAKELNIPVIKRPQLLAMIAASRKTIAVGGTSGKSTTAAMLFSILEYAGLEPGIISGAGLISIMKEGKIGNAKTGKGEWLVIEADESDGSIVEYEPEVGLLLNIDKDHKEINTLMEIFTIFKNRTKKLFVVNQAHALARQLSQNIQHDFSVNENFQAGYMATDFYQSGLSSSFKINGASFHLNQIGKHNMENALAASAVANQTGIDLQKCSGALQHYEGIYRRHQVYGKKRGVWLIDDYAHNPVKCAVSIKACQAIALKVIAWFQPHGYAPTKFLRTEFVKEISIALRASDEIWMSEIFYAGGTTEKDISAADLINDLKQLDKQAFFVENRNNFLPAVRSHFTDDCVLLLMGARDPSLEQFAQRVWEEM